VFHTGATSAPRHRSHSRRGAAAARIALGAVFVTSVMAAPHFTAPEAVEASSCTGWTSLSTPPRTIKVLRTNKGTVQKVPFRRYVAEVMASGEWPGRLRKATLEAGAVATKQYAWYYAMKGNHRSSYRRNGSCYDVRDDTVDQLYRPEKTNPTATQQAAVTKTWGLTLRKKGRFFLTGYRAGSSGTCGADAHGWKLYARSAEACAKKGWSYQRILNRYYGPKLKLVSSITTGPLIRNPNFVLKSGTNYSSGAATVSWKPTAAGTNVARYRLQRKIGQGDWKSLSIGSATARSTTAWVKTGVNNRFRIRGEDSKGRTGPWAYSAKRRAAIRGPVGISLSGSGVDPASDPIKVKTSFDGRSIALMARAGPNMGKVRVLLNGKKVATVDLKRSQVTRQALVWARNFSAAKLRSIAVKALDPGARVDFDGFFILR
jgi:hypothetical protein